MEIQHEETLLTGQVAYIQAALLYTSSAGERRIRCLRPRGGVRGVGVGVCVGRLVCVSWRFRACARACVGGCVSGWVGVQVATRGLWVVPCGPATLQPLTQQPPPALLPTGCTPWRFLW